MYFFFGLISFTLISHKQVSLKIEINNFFENKSKVFTCGFPYETPLLNKKAARIKDKEKSERKTHCFGTDVRILLIFRRYMCLAMPGRQALRFILNTTNRQYVPLHLYNSFDNFAIVRVFHCLVDIFKIIEFDQFIERELSCFIEFKQFGNKQLWY